MYTTNGSLHNTYRKNAVIAWTLFIVATAANLLGSNLTGSILDAPEYLDKISSSGNRMCWGRFCRSWLPSHLLVSPLRSIQY